ERLNHFNTERCVAAERAFLAAMGGGCQSPVAAYAEVSCSQIRMRALSFAAGPVRLGQTEGLVKEAVELGQRLAEELMGCRAAIGANENGVFGFRRPAADFNAGGFASVGIFEGVAD